MSYVDAREFIRNQIIARAQYQQAFKRADRYWRKEPQNRPPVAEVPQAPPKPAASDGPMMPGVSQDWQRILVPCSLTAYHTTYNYLRGKPNCHVIKYDQWRAAAVNREVETLIEWLQEQYGFVLGQPCHAE